MPRAAFSHSASVGRRAPAQRQKAVGVVPVDVGDGMPLRAPRGRRRRASAAEPGVPWRATNARYCAFVTGVVASDTAPTTTACRGCLVGKPTPPGGGAVVAEQHVARGHVDHVDVEPQLGVRASGGEPKADVVVDRAGSIPCRYEQRISPARG